MQQSKSIFLIRPYCQEFLDEVSKYYEVVIFTAAVKEYADNILDNID
jgi:CTD small phosphatase-like protein 2